MPINITSFRIPANNSNNNLDNAFKETGTDTYRGVTYKIGTMFGQTAY